MQDKLINYQLTHHVMLLENDKSKIIVRNKVNVFCSSFKNIFKKVITKTKHYLFIILLSYLLCAQQH